MSKFCQQWFEHVFSFNAWLVVIYLISVVLFISSWSKQFQLDRNRCRETIESQETRSSFFQPMESKLTCHFTHVEKSRYISGQTNKPGTFGQRDRSVKLSKISDGLIHGSLAWLFNLQVTPLLCCDVWVQSNYLCQLKPPSLQELAGCCIHPPFLILIISWFHIIWCHQSIRKSSEYNIIHWYTTNNNLTAKEHHEFGLALGVCQKRTAIFSIHWCVS